MMKHPMLFLVCIAIAFNQTPDDRGYIVNVSEKSPDFILDFPDG